MMTARANAVSGVGCSRRVRFRIESINSGFALVIPGWSSRSPSVHADTSRSNNRDVSAFADSMIAANLK